jgi:hypothetical protein
LLSLAKAGKEKKRCCFGHFCYIEGEKIRPRYIETARVPKLAEGTSSVVEPEYPASTGAKGESAEVSMAMEQEKTETVELPKRLAEAKEKRSKNQN